MPIIAQDDVSFLHTRESDKQEVSINLLESTLAVNKENYNKFKNLWFPISVLLVLILLFIPMVGLMAAAVYHCDKYSDVIVTPYSDIYFSNFTGVMLLSCLY